MLLRQKQSVMRANGVKILKFKRERGAARKFNINFALHRLY